MPLRGEVCLLGRLRSNVEVALRGKQVHLGSALIYLLSFFHCGQVQGQLGFASLNLDLALVDLRGVSGGLPDATPALVVQVKTWT